MWDTLFIPTEAMHEQVKELKKYVNIGETGKNIMSNIMILYQLRGRFRIKDGGQKCVMCSV